MIYVQGDPKEAEEAERIVGAAHRRQGSGVAYTARLHPNIAECVCFLLLFFLPPSHFPSPQRSPLAVEYTRVCVTARACVRVERSCRR